MDVIVRCTLRDRRLFKRLSQRQLEQLSGIHRGTISKYERNEENMPIERAALFAILLDCRLDDIFEYYPVAGED